MTRLRTALLIAAAFALGTSVTSIVASRRFAWSSPEFIAAAASAFLLCAWLLSSRVRTLKESPRVSPFGLSLTFNIVLLGMVTYFALGVRQQRYWLDSRFEAALSLISPRLLPPSRIHVPPYSSRPVANYEPATCLWPGQQVGFLGGRILTVEASIEDISIESGGGATFLHISFRQGNWQTLAEFIQSHPGDRLAFVTSNQQVLLDIAPNAPMLDRHLRFDISESALDRLIADRLVLWFRRTPPIAA